MQYKIFIYHYHSFDVPQKLWNHHALDAVYYLLPVTNKNYMRFVGDVELFFSF